MLEADRLDVRQVFEGAVVVSHELSALIYKPVGLGKLAQAQGALNVCRPIVETQLLHLVIPGIGCTVFKAEVSVLEVFRLVRDAM